MKKADAAQNNTFRKNFSRRYRMNNFCMHDFLFDFIQYKLSGIQIAALKNFVEEQHLSYLNNSDSSGSSCQPK